LYSFYCYITLGADYLSVADAEADPDLKKYALSCAEAALNESGEVFSQQQLRDMVNRTQKLLKMVKEKQQQTND
jgi:hypothetical protein